MQRKRVALAIAALAVIAVLWVGSRPVVLNGMTSGGAPQNQSAQP